MTKAIILTKLKAIKPVLNEKFNIEKIALFGSYATEKNTEDSDIDLLIEFAEDKRLDYFGYEKLRDFLTKEFNDTEIDIVDKKYINPIINFFAEKNMIYV